MVITGNSDFGKEENLLFLISELVQKYEQPEAKVLLGKGMQPVEAAMQTGFSDQSHFTNYFTRFIGLVPGVYRDIFFDRKGDGE